MNPLWVLSIFFTVTDSFEIINATRGSSFLLPCEPAFGFYYEGFQVKWSKKGLDEVICHYFLNETDVRPMTCMSSFKPSLRGLKVKYFNSDHSGSYNCSIIGIIPPPNRDLNTTTVELRTVGTSLELVNTTDSDCIELLCTMDGIDQEKVSFIWNWRGKNKSEQVITNSSSSVSSSLHLCGAERRDGDTITCSVSHPSGHFTSSWTIPEQNVHVGNEDSNWTVITICICASTGAVLLIAMAVIIYKCK
ncbi:uncharacterized protein LOC134080178 isoform X2 [Sardina pilchardus]